MVRPSVWITGKGFGGLSSVGDKSGGLGQGGSGRWYERSLDSSYTSKTKLTAFRDGLAVVVRDKGRSENRD